MSSLIRGLPDAVWSDKGFPPVLPNKEDGYEFYTVFRRASSDGAMTYYLHTTDDNDGILTATLQGVTNDPLKDVRRCYLKISSDVIKGIILDTDWVECQDQ